MPDPADPAAEGPGAASPAALTGSCLCGAVAYAVSPPPVFAQSCHCSRCRKVFSGAGSAVAMTEPGAFRWTRGKDRVTAFDGKGGEGIRFCGTCGSTLAGLLGGEVVCVTLGTLDGDPPIRLARHIHAASRAGWDEIGGDAPQFAEGPPEAG